MTKIFGFQFPRFEERVCIRGWGFIRGKFIFLKNRGLIEEGFIRALLVNLRYLQKFPPKMVKPQCEIETFQGGVVTFRIARYAPLENFRSFNRYFAQNAFLPEKISWFYSTN